MGIVRGRHAFLLVPLVTGDLDLYRGFSCPSLRNGLVTSRSYTVPAVGTRAQPTYQWQTGLARCNEGQMRVGDLVTFTKTAVYLGK